MERPSQEIPGSRPCPVETTGGLNKRWKGHLKRSLASGGGEQSLCEQEQTSLCEGSSTPLASDCFILARPFLCPCCREATKEERTVRADEGEAGRCHHRIQWTTPSFCMCVCVCGGVYEYSLTVHVCVMTLRKFPETE